MRISYNWLKEYIATELSPQEISELLTDIGLEVEDLSEYKGPGNGLEGLVIGQVKKVEKHPDADKLQLTQVDIGNGETHQIVCGAPNVAEGQKVVVALPGVTLYPLKGEPFTIKQAKIRGVESNGMICAEDEIGFGADHAGIIVLPENAQVGLKAKTYYGLKDDFIFEIGLTPNRADAYSHIGVARDLRAAINVRQDKNLELKLPAVDEKLFQKTETPIEVIIENPEACPRYSGILIRNVKVGESPAWLKEKLRSVGQRPINNIVDITNFILQEYGQPLHAFDADKIKGGKVIVKTLPAQTKFTTLDEVERTLHAEDLMICNAEAGMCIAGVFGGLSSGVQPPTTSIFLESAYFNPVSIRKTFTRHGLRTDAAMHFEKGADPNCTVTVLKRATQLILEIAGGEIASAVVDVNPKPIPNSAVTLRYTHLDRLIGIRIDADAIHDILENLEIKITNETQDALELSVPPFKTDVQREVDVIEEVLRIYGVNHIPLPENIRTSISLRTDTDFRENLKNVVSDYLASIGFNEMVNNSISRTDYYGENEKIVQLQKSANADLNVLRTNMLYSGLEVAAWNLNRKNNDLKLFEIGKIYTQFNPGEYHEEWRLSLIVTGMKRAESWTEKQQPADFYFLKTVAENILKRCGLKNFTSKEADENIFSYGLSFSYQENSKTLHLVEFGIVKKEFLKQTDVRQPVFYADFHWENIVALAKMNSVQFREIPRFPGVRRDLALLLNNEITFASIENIAKEEGRKLLKSVHLFDVYTDEKLGAAMKSYAVSYFFEDEEKTLTDKDVDKLMTRLMSRYKEELKAEIR